MKRGDVYWANLDPARQSEADKRRPVIVVSNDRANAVAARLGRGTVTVVPVTTSTDRVYPFQVWIATGDGGLKGDSKAQAEQVRSISIERLGSKLGTLDTHIMDAVDAALRLHLNL